MANFLIIVSGLAWTIVYIDSIRIGLKDKTFAMPFWALALNIAWELLHAVFGFREVGLTLQIAINAIWFLFDLGLLYTFFRYGQRYFPKTLSSILVLRMEPFWVIYSIHCAIYLHPGIWFTHGSSVFSVLAKSSHVNLIHRHACAAQW